MLAQSDRTGPAAPSAYAAARLASVDYMRDASPAVITNLREHCRRLTSADPAAASHHRAALRSAQIAERKLQVLQLAGRPDLFVPEPLVEDAAGAGSPSADWARYHEALVAMARGSVLAEATSDRRAIVWEIGPGWGGLAYQFKSLFPNVTYVLSDFPERFLFSATYLRNVLPQASVAFFERGVEVEWDSHDFVFVPNDAIEAIAPPRRIDLTIAVSSFEEMTSAHVAAHVAHAYERGCPYLCNFGRDRAPANRELESAHEIAARWFWLHDVDMPRSGKFDEERSELAFRESSGYRYAIGWRRLKP